MKTHISGFLAKAFMVLLMVTAGTAAMSGQEYENTPVEVSKEKVKIDGQVCYSHVVLEKQTLFSISKAYDVSIDDIYRFNPALKETGLKKNSILIIPASVQKETVAKDESRPVQENKPEPRKKRTIHTVKWFEDLDMIAERYGVAVESIMQLNNLKDKKLSRRQKLMIPYKDEVFEVPEEEVEKEAADSLATTDSTVLDDRSLFPGMFQTRKDVKVSLLLPFKATGSTSSRSNMDFYSGVLLALYDLGNEGISTDLQVYDIADGRLPSSEAINSSDLVIGPISSGDVSRLFASDSLADAVVAPLDQRVAPLAYTHKGLIQAPTPHEIQYKDLMSWIGEDMRAGDRMLVISEKGAVQTDAITQMKAAADSSGLQYAPLAYSILEGRNVTGSLEYLMTETGANRVFIASESEAFVNDVVRNLNIMIHKKYDVVLYAPSKIRSFETIEVENFHNTSMHVSLGYYIDYEDARVKDFLLRYRALYNTEPTQSAFQGYDIARYFITLCSKYGDRWQEKLDRSDMTMLQNSFRFRKAGEGGYINTGVQRIIYSDGWSVVKVR